MIINFYATLRQIVGGKKVDLDIPPGATVRYLLDEIIKLYPLIKRELFNEKGELYCYTGEDEEALVGQLKNMQDYAEGAAALLFFISFEEE